MSPPTVGSIGSNVNELARFRRRLTGDPGNRLRDDHCRCSGRTLNNRAAAYTAAKDISESLSATGVRIDGIFAAIELEFRWHVALSLHLVARTGQAGT